MKGSFIIFSLLFICLYSCCKNDIKTTYPVGSNENINQWMLDSMRTFYYWNNSLPLNPNLKANPFDFFSLLKNENDKFSMLVNTSRPGTYFNTMSNIFGFDIASTDKDGKLYTVITIVVPRSPAASKGLQRGQQVIAIDDQPVSGNNINALLQAALRNKTITIKKNDNQTVNVSAAYFSEASIYTHRIYDTLGKKIGYLFLNNFEPTAVNDILSIFNNFKQKNITELILDLRYNFGGSIPVAATLGTLTAPAKETDIFVNLSGNKNVGTVKSTFKNELSKLSLAFNEVHNNSLNLSRVFILAGRYSASASEMLINCLSPYTRVVHIGETTYGKDMASIEIKDRRNPIEVQGWGMYPIVYKLYNSKGVGDYPNGLQPHYNVSELMTAPYLYPFGDPRDALIKTALQIIGNEPRLKSAQKTRQIYHSLDQSISTHSLLY